MIIISAQKNRHFSYSGGAQKKMQREKKNKMNYSVLIV